MSANPENEPQRRARWPAVVVLVAIVVIAIVVWNRMRSPRVAPAPAPVVTAPAPAPAPVAAPEPEVRHPVEAIAVEPIPRAEPLPPRDDSDGALVAALAALVGESPLAQFFFGDTLVRRFVLTVDNLPRETLPMRVRAAKATPGPFATAGSESGRTIHAENARRYEPFVRFVQGVDARRIVAIYLRFYPLLQEEYRSIGFPNRQFNDRVVEAIDDLLAAPEPQGPIALVQPKVMYRYADPELESLSAGRKIMVRIGADNARALKAKLREIRAILAGPAAAR